MRNLNIAISVFMGIAMLTACSSKQQLDNESDSDSNATNTVFVEPLQLDEKRQQMLYQLNSNHVFSLNNDDVGMALNLDQYQEQRDLNRYTIQFKAQLDGSILRFNSDEVRKERDPKGRVAFVGSDDAHQLIIVHYADSLKEDEVPVGDMAMQQNTVDSLSYFDVKLVKRGTTDTTHLAFWGYLYTDHRLHGHWVMSEVNGFDEIAPEGYEDKVPHMTIRMDDMTVEGFAGCNRFSGPFRQFGKNIDVSSLAMTKMFCETRTDILSFLDKSVGYRLEGNRLIFEFSAGSEIVFEKQG